MSRYLVVIVVLSCASVGRADSVYWSSETGTYWDSSTYQYWNNGGGKRDVVYSWTEANALAKSMTPPVGYQQGHLLTIGDQDEHNFIFVRMLNSGRRAWLGISDVDVMGEWRWADSTPGIYQDPKLFPNPTHSLPFANWRQSTFFKNEWTSPTPYDLRSATASYGITGYLWDGLGDPSPDGMVWGTTSAADRALVIVEFDRLPVPEPATFVLGLLGALIFAGVRTTGRCTFRPF